VFGDLNGLQSEHFFRPHHEYLFSLLQRMYLDGTEIDALTLFAELEKEGRLTRVGGATYLHTLLEAPATTLNVSYYANIVKEKWKLRKVNELGQRLLSLDADDVGDIPAALDAARTFLDDVDAEAEQRSLDFHELYAAWTDHIEDDRPAILTPWHELNDRLSGGLHRQRLYVIGARPGCGKTIMLSQIGIYTALSHHKVMWFSLELSKEDLMGRMLACGSHANYAEITAKSMTPETYGKISQWAGASASMSLAVDDDPEQTIESIAQACRIAKQRNGLDVVCIDYLQLISPSQGQGRVEQVDYIATKARAIARKLDVAVCVAAQLNRKIEDHGGRPRLPTKSDFRESGGIEQTADVALVLSRPPDENGEEATRMPMMNVSLVKNRTGTEGTFQLIERFDQARFQ
jgi:replicative DNA helicase